MNQQTKQKVLIAVLAVLALGAGGYFFAFRDSGGKGARATNTGPTIRRVRESSASDQKTTRRTARGERKAKAPAPTVRRARVEREEKTVERRKRGRGKDRRKKKETITPAA